MYSKAVYKIFLEAKSRVQVIKFILTTWLPTVKVYTTNTDRPTSSLLNAEACQPIACVGSISPPRVLRLAPTPPAEGPDATVLWAIIHA